MSAKNTKQNRKQSQPASDDVAFPGAAGDNFGNQYFEKQGPSSQAPYDHSGTRPHQEQVLEGDSLRHHPEGMGNKDEYQAGKTKISAPDSKA